MRLGIILRKWRLMFDLEIKDVAREIGISPSTLTRLEGGGMPDGETLAKVLCFMMAPDAPAKPVAATPEQQPLIEDRTDSTVPAGSGARTGSVVNARAIGDESIAG